MNNKKMIVVITGCLGFIGSYVTRECLNKGWYVYGIDKITRGSHPELIDEFSVYKNHFTFIQQDINDVKHLPSVDYLINISAETHVDFSIEDSSVFLHSNVNGVHNLLELIRKRKDRPIFFHFSTDEVYGDVLVGSHKETDLLKPSNPYSASKACGDHLIQSWHRTYDIPYLIVRPTNNYGALQDSYKLIPKICRCLQTGHKIPLHNNGTPKRMWLHSRDTAKAVVKLIESGVQNDIYNISGNYEAQNIEVVKKIAAIHYGKDDVDPSEYCDFSHNRQGQDVRYSIDDSKLHTLGWNNEAIFDNELPTIYQYYKENFIW